MIEQSKNLEFVLLRVYFVASAQPSLWTRLKAAVLPDILQQDLSIAAYIEVTIVCFDKSFTFAVHFLILSNFVYFPIFPVVYPQLNCFVLHLSPQNLQLQLRDFDFFEFFRQVGHCLVGLLTLKHCLFRLNELVNTKKLHFTNFEHHALLQLSWTLINDTSRVRRRCANYVVAIFGYDDKLWATDATVHNLNVVAWTTSECQYIWIFDILARTIVHYNFICVNFQNIVIF